MQDYTIDFLYTHDSVENSCSSHQPALTRSPCEPHITHHERLDDPSGFYSRSNHTHGCSVWLCGLLLSTKPEKAEEPHTDPSPFHIGGAKS